MGSRRWRYIIMKGNGNMPDPIVCRYCGFESWSDFGHMQHLIRAHNLLSRADQPEYNGETDAHNNPGQDSA